MKDDNLGIKGGQKTIFTRNEGSSSEEMEHEVIDDFNAKEFGRGASEFVGSNTHKDKHDRRRSTLQPAPFMQAKGL